MQTPPEAFALWFLIALFSSSVRAGTSCINAGVDYALPNYVASLLWALGFFLQAGAFLAYRIAEGPLLLAGPSTFIAVVAYALVSMTNLVWHRVDSTGRFSASLGFVLFVLPLHALVIIMFIVDGSVGAIVQYAASLPWPVYLVVFRCIHNGVQEQDVLPSRMESQPHVISGSSTVQSLRRGHTTAGKIRGPQKVRIVKM